MSKCFPLYAWFKKHAHAWCKFVVWFTHANTHTHARTCARKHVSMHAHTHKHACTCTCARAHTHAHTHTRTHTPQTCAHAHTCRNMCVHVHAHTHTHTHTHTRWPLALALSESIISCAALTTCRTTLTACWWASTFSLVKITLCQHTTNTFKTTHIFNRHLSTPEGRMQLLEWRWMLCINA